MSEINKCVEINWRELWDRKPIDIRPSIAVVKGLSLLDGTFRLNALLYSWNDWPCYYGWIFKEPVSPIQTSKQTNKPKRWTTKGLCFRVSFDKSFFFRICGRLNGEKGTLEREIHIEMKKRNGGNGLQWPWETFGQSTPNQTPNDIFLKKFV